MIFRLPTVRAKLTALVATTVVTMMATLPILSWLLHRQLVDEVDNRVEDAQKSFQEELRDDLDDLTLAGRVIAIDSDTVRAIEAGDAKRADDLAEIFVGVYPELDVLLADAGGKVLAQVGCTSSVGSIDRIPEIGRAGKAGGVLGGASFRGVSAHGCEASPTAPPAYVIAVPVRRAAAEGAAKDSGVVVGAVVVCLPFNGEYLANASRKLGLELSLASADHTTLERTRGFPRTTPRDLGKKSKLVEEGDQTFAMVEFQPPELAADGHGLTLSAALDVTDIRRLVRQNLFFSLGVLALATMISVVFGTRLAQIMSTALKRVNVALKKLENQEYVHIDALRTGDELEDLASGFNLMVDGLKERDKLRTTFGKYMTSQVMDHLMSGKVQLGGETLTVTILFTDIRSFTSISEKMDAQALVGLLNEYFTEMVGIVMDEDGVVDKYIGDAIMAVFGAPVPKPDDAIHAVRAAVRMRKALVHLNERLAERGLGPLRTGIGIHTGEVVAGNIGSERRMEYTVIGDAVNVASRLESNTKDLGVNVLISEDTFERAKAHVDARPVTELTVKGRAQPVKTYEVLGLTGEPPLSSSAKDEA